VFFITDVNGNPVSDPQLCQALQDTLKKELDAHGKTQGKP